MFFVQFLLNILGLYGHSLVYLGDYYTNLYYIKNQKAYVIKLCSIFNIYKF
jgi:hypothetical protein